LGRCARAQQPHCSATAADESTLPCVQPPTLGQWLPWVGLIYYLLTICCEHLLSSIQHFCKFVFFILYFLSVCYIIINFDWLYFLVYVLHHFFQCNLAVFDIFSNLESSWIASRFRCLSKKMTFHYFSHDFNYYFMLI
jgi:hypothetical protein